MMSNAEKTALEKKFDQAVQPAMYRSRGFAQDHLEAFGDLSEDRSPLGRIGGRFSFSNSNQRCRREKERRGVEDHRYGRFEEFDDGTRERGPSGVGDRVARLQLAVRIDELLALHEGGKEGLVRDTDEDGQDSDEE